MSAASPVVLGPDFDPGSRIVDRLSILETARPEDDDHHHDGDGNNRQDRIPDQRECWRASPVLLRP